MHTAYGDPAAMAMETSAKLKSGVMGGTERKEEGKRGRGKREGKREGRGRGRGRGEGGGEEEES